MKFSAKRTARYYVEQAIVEASILLIDLVNSFGKPKSIALFLYCL